ncbi:MAG: hypothetical protein R2822_24515 [Spirosomataceae bacterium]
MESLSWLPEVAKNNATPAPIPAHFTQEESHIVALLRQKGEMQIDDLTWESKIAPGRLATMLLSLELQGYVRVLPGKKFALA